MSIGSIGLPIITLSDMSGSYAVAVLSKANTKRAKKMSNLN